MTQPVWLYEINATMLSGLQNMWTTARISIAGRRKNQQWSMPFFVFVFLNMHINPFEHGEKRKLPNLISIQVCPSYNANRQIMMPCTFSVTWFRRKDQEPSIAAQADRGCLCNLSVWTPCYELPSYYSSEI